MKFELLRYMQDRWVVIMYLPTGLDASTPLPLDDALAWIRERARP